MSKLAVLTLITIVAIQTIPIIMMYKKRNEKINNKQRILIYVLGIINGIIIIASS